MSWVTSRLGVTCNNIPLSLSRWSLDKQCVFNFVFFLYLSARTGLSATAILCCPSVRVRGCLRYGGVAAEVSADLWRSQWQRHWRSCLDSLMNLRFRQHYAQSKDTVSVPNISDHSLITLICIYLKGIRMVSGDKIVPVFLITKKIFNSSFNAPWVVSLWHSVFASGSYFVLEYYISSIIWRKSYSPPKSW